jgi:hypothetical protein
MYGTVRGFEKKLKLFWKQFEYVNLCHFSSCDLLHKDGSVSTLFLSVSSLEMIDSLDENFKMKFTDFHSHVTNIYLSKTQSLLLKSVMIQKNGNMK